jgi:nicotinic acid mononucleotide adenylyltransferase
VNRPGARHSFRPEDYPGVSLEIVERLERDRVEMAPCPVESRKIRERLRRGESIEGMVPAKVAEHIARRGLYLASR